MRSPQSLLLFYLMALSAAAVSFSLAASPAAMAAGTPAGTEITNRATATYTVGAVSGLKKESDIHTIRVDELIDVQVIWQDATDVVASPGAADQALVFKVANTGNGSEAFTLDANSAIAGDDFDPALVDIFFDVNGNSKYDPGTDIEYIPGTNDPTIAADAYIILLILNNIPLGLDDGNLGDSMLTAASKTGTGPPGTGFAAKGDGGTDAVIGTSGGAGYAKGTYMISNVVVNITKSAQVSDPFGGSRRVPGATITYTILVTVAGSGTARNVVIEDAVPANTTYKPGSITLNGADITDQTGDDGGDFGGTAENAVTVSVGDLSMESTAPTITFQVIIN